MKKYFKIYWFDPLLVIPVFVYYYYKEGRSWTFFDCVLLLLIVIVLYLVYFAVRGRWGE